MSPNDDIVEYELLLIRVSQLCHDPFRDAFLQPLIEGAPYRVPRRKSAIVLSRYTLPSQLSSQHTLDMFPLIILNRMLMYWRPSLAHSA